MIRHLIFDLDDTLISCGKYYHALKREFAANAAQRTGLPEALCHNILGKIDVECTHLPHGWGKERFPKSFAATSLALDVIAGLSIDIPASQRAYMLGEQVFSAPYEKLPFTDAVLRRMVNDGMTLYLLTKGDFEIQQSKILSNQLFEYVDPTRVYIVPRKTGECIERIMLDHNLTNVDECIMIGDSIRDDIGSACDVGMRSVLVQTGYAWAYETTQRSPTWSISDLSELPALLSMVQEQDDDMYTSVR